MGVQATLRDIASGFLTATAHTANNTDIEASFNKALDRTDNVDNAMEVDLDFGNYRGINLDDGVEDSDAANMRQLRNAIQDSITDGASVATAIDQAVDVAVADAVSAAGTGFVVQRVEYQTGFTQGQTVVTLLNISYVPGVNNVTVALNGLLQTSGVDYTEDGVQQLTMTLPLDPDDRLIVKSNASTTSAVSDSTAVSHTYNSSTATVSSYINNIINTLNTLINTEGLTHTNVDGTVDLDVYLDAQKTAVDNLEAAALNNWETEAGGVNPLFMTGAIMAFASNGVKSGWTECDGKALSRTVHSGLFAEIGTTYGSGDGSTTFNVPDLRGLFVRGWDAGRGVDTGRVLGTFQSDAFASHSHKIGYEKGTSRGSPDNPPGLVSSITQTTEPDIVTWNVGGTETRPVNMALPYYIKL